ncbi:alpha-mannosidase 2, partial [Lasius niger]
MYKILRRGSGRVFVLGVVVLSLLLCLYYVSQVQAPPSSSSSSSSSSSGHPAAAAAAILNEELRYDRSSLTSVTPDYSESPDARVSLATCPAIAPRNADIDAQQEFSKFDFQ